SGTVNVDEGYAFAWGSLSAPMGGMGLSGVGRRHGPEGLLKYTESQTIATARVFNLDPPFGIPATVWQKSLLPIVRTVMKLPGRR
ncbi:succinic semialdehyde dehydrogenase, partial [Mycobacterium tuberculosis]|nr:succinic semialdehyde dehydrogenase [Mycobacterium tuberculosis]